jgi:transposase-like protein
MDKPRMEFPDAPTRCANCYSWPSFVDLNQRDLAEGRDRRPRCESCGYSPQVRFTEPYRGGVRVVKEE